MGSVARPLQPGPAMLAEIEAISRRYGLSAAKLIPIFDAAMDDLRTREATVRFLVLYLSRCVTGSAPDYRQ